MTITLVDVGTTANDGTGDPLRTAFQTVNTAMTLVDNAVVVGTGVTTFKDDSGTLGVSVLADGKTGLGTTAPSYALDVRTATGNADVQVRASASNHAYFRLSANAGTNTAQFYCLSGGTCYILNNTNSASIFVRGRDSGGNITDYFGGANGQAIMYGNGVATVTVKTTGVVNIANLPTSAAGLSAGDLWNNSGVLNVA